MKNYEMGLSENSVPLHPMVNDQISLLNGYFIGGIPHFQTYPNVQSQEDEQSISSVSSPPSPRALPEGSKSEPRRQGRRTGDSVKRARF